HALVLDGNQNPVTGRLVHIAVTAGPNAGWFADGVTDGSGLFAFSYTGAGGPGTDVIMASMTDAGGVARTSNTVSVLWTETPVPPQESIVLYPATAARNVGQQHTVTAMVLDAAGSPVFGREVRINVTAGPNAGDAVTGMTGASGTVAFTYTGDGGTGRDTLQAAMIGAGGTTVTSNTAIVDWSIPPTPVPEFPGIGIPVALLGLLAIVCRSMRRH
ncbi:MAG: hypothetical protein GKC04_08810, partial [Methanomicrobiales archaeon]|nr:hypothetical protein [Methanomicrobiales archaeon]